MQSNIIHKWLNDRGITDEVIALFNIQTDYQHPQIGECLKIPVSNATHPFNKYRRHPLDDRKPKYLYDTGGKVTLYGLNHLTHPTKVLITEGELDTLVAWSHNIPAVSSTGGAMSFQPEWADLLKDYDVYLCFDNDDAGAEGMVKVLEYLPTAHVVLIPETPGVKDISDYVARGGNLTKLLQSSKTYPDTILVEEDYNHRKATWQSTRFHEKYLEKHQAQQQRRTDPNPYTGTDPVLKARTYPMEHLIEFQRRKASCPWHNEKTPSLQYYPKTNTAYCFGGCGRAYDAIDAYMLKHNVGFKEAIKELNKLT